MLFFSVLSFALRGGFIVIFKNYFLKSTALIFILIVFCVVGKTELSMGQLPENARLAGQKMIEVLESLYDKSNHEIDLVLVARDGQNLGQFQWLKPNYELSGSLGATLKQPTLFEWLRGENPFFKQAPMFSHVGICIRQHLKLTDEPWAFRHLLRSKVIDGQHTGVLYDQTTSQFFNDDPESYRYAIVIPSREMQIKIRDFIFQEDKIDQVFIPYYNSLAYPFVNDHHPETIDMNSNQYVLHSVVAASLSEQNQKRLEIEKVNFIQKHIWDLGFVPDHLWIGNGSKMQGSRIKPLLFSLSRRYGSANLNTIPQRDNLREYRNTVVPVVTFESMVDFFRDNDWLKKDLGEDAVILMNDFRFE